MKKLRKPQMHWSQGGEHGGLKAKEQLDVEARAAYLYFPVEQVCMMQCHGAWFHCTLVPTLNQHSTERQQLYTDFTHYYDALYLMKYTTLVELLNCMVPGTWYH